MVQNSSCSQRWNGDNANFAYTAYRNTSDVDGALWYPRYINIGQVAFTY